MKSSKDQKERYSSFSPYTIVDCKDTNKLKKKQTLTHIIAYPSVRLTLATIRARDSAILLASARTWEDIKWIKHG